MQKTDKTKKLSPDWVTTAEVCTKLGISNDHLYRLLPHLKQGYHYLNISFSKFRASYRWNLKRLEDFFKKALA